MKPVSHLNLTLNEVISTYSDNTVQQKALVLQIVRRDSIELEVIQLPIGFSVRIVSNKYVLETFNTKAAANFYIKQLSKK